MKDANVILLVIDSLRYDYAMDNVFFTNLSKRGLSFERMYSPSSFTSANMSSVRSGMYPPRHGWRSWPGNRLIKENIKTLEDFLCEAGYHVANEITMPINYGETQEFVDDGNVFRDMTAQEPFFLFSQYMGIHKGVLENGCYVVAHYRSLLSNARSFIGKAFDQAKEYGFDNKTLWVIMGDHGIRLDGDVKIVETGDAGAGQIYDFRNRIYCVLIGPGIEPRVLRGACSQIDLLPSILDYCEIPQTVPEEFLEIQGVSAFKEPDPDRYVYLEAQSPFSRWPSETPNVFGATNGRIKLMLTPEGFKCYDLVNDPNETDDKLSFVELEPMLDFIREIKR